jgi:pimeloyl-ACP methyl ester carboxylesterase
MAVVLAGPATEDHCGWQPLALALRGAGYRVMTFDYEGVKPTDAVAAAVRTIRTRGATSVALVGASEGAKASLVEATKLHPSVAAVVAISPARFAEGADLAPIVRMLHAPTLYVYAGGDFISTDTPLLFRETASADKKLETLEGTDHAFDLLRGDQASKVTMLVVSFLNRLR